MLMQMAAFLPLILLSTQLEDANIDFPCNKSVDLLYGGAYYDCKHRNLGKIPQCGFNNATTVDLRNNRITIIENQSFVGLSLLRKLMLNNNQIIKLEELAFTHTPNLNVLSLSFNLLRLNNLSYPPKVFANLKDLVELNIIGNNVDISAKYPAWFLHLKSLQVLSIDAISDLSFGSEFHELQSLRQLTIHSNRDEGMVYISNDTFINLPYLETLNLTNCPIYGLDENAFKPLNNINTLIMRNTKNINLYSAIRALHVFRGRQMTEVDLSRVYFVTHLTKSENRSNRFLTREILAPLLDICISNVSLARNLLLYIEGSSFKNKTLTKCIKHLDVSKNLILGAIGFYSILGIFTNLKYFDISNQNRWACDHGQTMWNKRQKYKVFNPNSSSKLTGCLENFPFTRSSTDHENSTKAYIDLPPTLKVLSARSALNARRFLCEYTIVFRNTDYIEHMDLSYWQLSRIHKQILGLNKLRQIDLSGNDFRDVNPLFFGEFGSLKSLILQDAALGSVSYLEQVFSMLDTLEKLDISSNELTGLTSQFCSNSKNLSTIILSGNMLQDIPKFVYNLHHLSVLDISYNMLTNVNKDQRTMFDILPSTHRVSLKLKGNTFSCGCETLDFISWLDTTTVHLDKEDDYQCVTEDGHPSNVSYILYNYNMIWRRCVGQHWLCISMATMISLFFTVAIVWIFITNKTKISHLIITFVMGRVVEQPKRQDYAFDAYIGHCENDWKFVCGKLRQILEVNIGLKLFLRDRDSHVSLPIADEMIRGIHTSWIYVLFLSPEFTEDLWMSFIIDRAIFETRYVPRRLVLMLIGDVDITSLPYSLLDIVPEENIIEVSDIGSGLEDGVFIDLCHLKTE